MTAPSAATTKTVTVPVALRPIFGQFLDIQRGHVAAMERAMGTHDQENLTRLAHAVRGACATYQLPEAAAIASKLEKMARCNDSTAVRRLLLELNGYFHNLRVEFLDTEAKAPNPVASPGKNP